MSEKVLFVDDDQRILNGIARQFEDVIEFETAVSPEKALEMFDLDGPYAVVVSDMRMPGMNGYEFLTQIGERSSKTIRIMLTGNADLPEVKINDDDTLFRCLAKPCDREVLQQVVDEALSLYRERLNQSAV